MVIVITIYRVYSFVFVVVIKIYFLNYYLILMIVYVVAVVIFLDYCCCCTLMVMVSYSLSLIFSYFSFLSITRLTFHLFLRLNCHHLHLTITCYWNVFVGLGSLMLACYLNWSSSSIFCLVIFFYLKYDCYIICQLVS